MRNTSNTFQDRRNELTPTLEYFLERNREQLHHKTNTKRQALKEAFMSVESAELFGMRGVK